jgi:carboxymethylenebutenolidase
VDKPASALAPDAPREDDMADRTLASRFDGFSMSAHRAAPAGARKGGVVVIQEIFGISDHIRAMCGVFAARGYEALAPSLFDRIEPGFQAGHDAAGIEKGRSAIFKCSWDQVAGDVQAAPRSMRSRRRCSSSASAMAGRWRGSPRSAATAFPPPAAFMDG